MGERELVGPRLYSCYKCRNHVCLHDDIISKAFQGRHGRAFLFSHAMNIAVGAKEDRNLMTGLHTVADISCADCSEVLGWKYERAFEASQKYKEGKFIFEKSKIVKENCLCAATEAWCNTQMYLKKAFWTDAVKPETEAERQSPVLELVKSLDKQRLYREVTLALRSGLREARAEFSFLRIRGLRSILKFLRSVAQSDDTINLFYHSQSIPALQVVPVLFQHTLREVEDQSVTNLNHIFSVEPMKISSPATDAEVALALRVLEGCCLLHCESTILAHQHKAITVLMNILSTRGVLEQGACLDALIAIMLDSSSNQMDFEACNGIEEVALLIKDKQVEENLRLKCGEFLLLLIGHVNGRETPPMMAIHEDIRQYLGEKSGSLIWAASQFGSTLDPEQRLTALQIQARRVLESIDLY
ncbi:binding protein [Perilla frutescens var. hirtella]|uniref:Binding protein n=1 Tax=Perilla frutescens var. hirtella TaxID=608512 RepID=A0AAD4JQG5_PERFH|nr:binding protein [Perilla frutescens var. hirtella]